MFIPCEPHPQYLEKPILTCHVIRANLSFQNSFRINSHDPEYCSYYAAKQSSNYVFANPINGHDSRSVKSQ